MKYLITCNSWIELTDVIWLGNSYSNAIVVLELRRKAHVGKSRIFAI